jgi:queuine tRNA-ribosyltransferase
LTTAHGVVETPIFMPVGTSANVKGVLPDRLKEIGSQIILSNTFHLYLRPGHERIAEFGGLHEFMNWDRPILTDSGGFQVFSLSKMNKITEEGVHFRSPLDGSKHFFTPEKTVEIQEALGSDIAMVFDECADPHASEQYIRESVDRTYRWAKQFHAAHKREDQMVFGIVQGGTSKELRKLSAEQITSIPFDGYAIGGLSVGEPFDISMETLAATTPHMPFDKARYLMGVGTPEMLFGGVERGVDMFDCVLPTRSARHGTLYTRQGKIRVKGARFKDDKEPLEHDCDCYTCRHYSKGYLNHLYNKKEITAMVLGSIHNIRFLTRLMDDIRASIEQDRFIEFKREFFNIYSG